jgi:hypothetical protein
LFSKKYVLYELSNVAYLGEMRNGLTTYDT